MKFSNRLKRWIAVCLTASILISCSKDNDDDGGGGGGGIPELPGYWKGNTTSPADFTNPINGLNVFLRAGNSARVYYSTSQRPLNDTTSSDVIKQDGTYTVSGDNVTITTSQIVCNGTKNAGFTNLQGTFKFTDFGITLTQGFVVKK